MSSIFDTERTPPPSVTRQPAAGLNNRISSSKSLGIGSIIGSQSNSLSRSRKLSTTNQLNRNRSIIESARNSNRTPPSNVAKQPAGSLRNLKSSIDRADSGIGSVISPRRTPPPNSVRQPAAGLDNRTSSSKTRGIGGLIGRQSETTSRMRKQIPTVNGNRENSRTRDTINNRNSTQILNGPARQEERITGSQPTRQIISGRANRKADRRQTTIIDNTTTRTDDQIVDTRVHRFETVSPTRLVYRDRPYYRRDRYRYECTYVDYHNRLRRKIIWPRYRYILCYNRGPLFSYRYFYPYYHRKYLFVSLGGYWPIGYNYLRYYWYGYHPYYWYGYYPIAREIESDTYNYYTYNYYYGDSGQGYASSRIADAGYFENLAQQPPKEPAEATLADTYFDEAVKAFEDGSYNTAVDKFAKAMDLAPEDTVLPFAYSQSLFAAKRYSEAAQVLREALKKVSPEKEGVFFPRGLYSDEDILLAQIDELATKTDTFSFDADLQLLLGYQLLGIGDYDKALRPLMNASRDLKNAQAAAVLIELLEKIKTADEEIQEPPDEEEIKTKQAETSWIPSEDVTALSQQQQSKIINRNHASKIKGTVLLATLCVLAGSTGIGHYFRG